MYQSNVHPITKWARRNGKPHTEYNSLFITFSTNNVNTYQKPHQSVYIFQSILMHIVRKKCTKNTRNCGKIHHRWDCCCCNCHLIWRYGTFFFLSAIRTIFYCHFNACKNIVIASKNSLWWSYYIHQTCVHVNYSVKCLAEWEREREKKRKHEDKLGK